ncbi:UNVERIFIED_CONTAM: hypothetical protein GTU68_045484 [Idotea baltica]|nr:hypothetical protein [Idotea baltica]
MTWVMGIFLIIIQKVKSKRRI